MVVLPERIELSTSPLPRECSTTELRQPWPDRRAGRRRHGIHDAPCIGKAGRRIGARGDLAAAIDNAVAVPFHRPMADRPAITPAKQAERQAREARLAKALRENLQRRKEQMRARRCGGPGAEGEDGAAEPPA